MSEFAAEPKTDDKDVPEWFTNMLRKALSQPLFNVPKPFESWMTDRVQFNGIQLPVGQIIGYENDRQATSVQKDTQSIPDSTQTSVTFNTLIYDATTLWPGSGSGLLTVRVPGIYLVVASGTWNTQTGGFRELIIKNNHGIVFGKQDTEATANLQGPSQTLATPMRVPLGDSIQLDAFQNSGVSVNLLAATLSAILINRFI